MDGVTLAKWRTRLGGLRDANDVAGLYATAMRMVEAISAFVPASREERPTHRVLQSLGSGPFEEVERLPRDEAIGFARGLTCESSGPYPRRVLVTIGDLIVWPEDRAMEWLGDDGESGG